MQMMLRDLYDDDPTGPHMQYALTEVADECRHSTMFGKAVAHFGIPAYGPQQRIHRLGRLFNTVVRGPSAYASILVAEETLDTWQRELMKDERVQPVTRMVSRIHVLEEARHMTFARDEVQRKMPGLSKAQLVLQQNLTAQVCFMVARALVNPAIYSAVGIDPTRGTPRGAGQPDTTARRCSGWVRSHSPSSARTVCCRRARSASGRPRCCWAEAAGFTGWPVKPVLVECCNPRQVHVSPADRGNRLLSWPTPSQW